MSPGGLFTHHALSIKSQWGFFSCCLCVGKCRSKPGKVSLTLAEHTSAKNRKCTALCLNHNFWQEYGILSGLGSKDEFNVRVKLLRNFYYLQAWSWPGHKFRTLTSVANATMLFLITNTHFGFVFILHWYYRKAMAEHQFRGRTGSCRLTDTIVLSSQAPPELGTEWKGQNG